MNKVVLEIENIHKSFGKLGVIKGISLKIKKGEVICLIGPSGGGKTVLLRIIAGLLKPEKGRIKLNREEVDKPTRSIGMVFQHYNIWPHKTVLENVIEAPIIVEKRPRSEVVEKAKRILKKVELLDKKDDYPRTLSGGQKQRTAIARTLTMNPEVILLDEITSALDPELVGGILKTIKRLAKEGRTMVVVTHHIKFASEIADKVVFLDDGEIVEEGPPEIVLKKPRNRRTGRFLKTILEKKQEINVYEGYEDFQAYHLGLLKRMKKGCTGYVIGAVGDRWYECIDEAFKEYQRIRDRKKISWKMVIYKLSKIDREVLQTQPSLNEFKVIPRKFETPANINIWEDTILLQTFGEPPAVIEIRNKLLVKGYINYFKLLWEMGKKV